jgi:lysozyme
MNADDIRNLRDSIKSAEGVRLLPYDDATGLNIRPGDVVSGQITIGYGRNLSGCGITQGDAEDFLDQDIRRSISDLFTQLPWTQQLDSARQVALAEMCFNLGIFRLKTFRKFLSALQGRNYEQAAVEMLDSHWADQVGARATRLASVIHSGEVK